MESNISTRDSSAPLVRPSANTYDDDSEIEYIGSAPSSPSRQHLALFPPKPPVSNEVECLGTSQNARCKQHVVSTKPGQSAIGAYPFLLHVEEHTPWEFSSYCRSLLLHARECEDRGLDKDGLCKPCRALLSNDKFVKVLARAQDGVQDYTPYKYHGLSSLTEIARKKEHTIQVLCL